MACGRCNKCNSSDPCGCQDHGLPTPCAYTDCSDPTVERCDEVVCAECVTWCGPTTTYGDPGSGVQIVINNGERLDSILQKYLLILANGLGGCTSNDVLHAPYNIYTGAITNNSITVVWGGESSATVNITVAWEDTNVPGVWNWITPIVPGIFTQIITGLLPATEYRIRVDADNGGGTPCKSVAILATTLL